MGDRTEATRLDWVSAPPTEERGKRKEWQREHIRGAAAPDFQRDCRGKLLTDENGQAIPLPDGRDEIFTAWLERDAAKLAIEEGVESDFASTGHNNRSITTPHGRNPMDTPPSPAECLLESLSRVSSFGQFWEAIRGYEDETVEDAIAHNLSSVIYTAIRIDRFYPMELF